MIIFTSGNIFDSAAHCIINPVNCVGVMGRGLARDFKIRFPEMFSLYAELCASGELRVGRIAFWKSTKKPRPVVCLFPTKDHWRSPSTMEIVESGLQAFVKNAPEYGIISAAFPMLGCGLGGLNFEKQIKPLMIQYLDPLPYPIEIYID